jgi:hypothetical protein
MLRDSLNMLPLIYRLLQLDMFYLAIIFNLSRPDCHEIISVLTASAKRSSTRQIRTGSSHFPLAGKVDALVIADVRPQLVKAIISIEATGPPFIGVVTSSGATRRYGLTDIPLTYFPPTMNTRSSYKRSSCLSRRRDWRTALCELHLLVKLISRSSWYFWTRVKRVIMLSMMTARLSS